MIRYLILLSCLALVACSDPTPPADLVLLNAKVYTVDGDRSRAEALAIRGEHIVAVGSNAEITAFQGDETRVVDLRGAMVLPGFQDAHVHPIDAGVSMNQCPLFDIVGEDRLLAAIADCVARDTTGAWIVGTGWSVDNFLPDGIPDKAPLDVIEPDRPMAFMSSDGHSLWVNSKALEIAGITATTPDPPGGRIDRYPGGHPQAGEPKGSLQESAGMTLVSDHVPKLSFATIMTGARYAVRHLNSLGITAIQDAWVSLDDGSPYAYFPHYAALDEAGELSLRVVASMYLAETRPWREQIDGIIKGRDIWTKGNVRALSVKIFADGVIEPKTAALIEPYLGEPLGVMGDMLHDPADLTEAVTTLDAKGFQVHIHAIGDRAIRESLNAFEAASAANGARDSRHHMAHLQLIDPADIPRFGALGVTANFQPLWAMRDSYVTDLTIPIIGAERGRWLYPIASVLASGGRVAFGSDWYVSSANPLLGIETAVTRQEATGERHPPLNLEEEGIPLADAIAAYTIHAAYVNFQDDRTGSIEPGKLADLVILSEDLFAIAPEDISDVVVRATLFGGRLVHGSLE